MKTPPPTIGIAEKVGNTIDELRFWLLHSWRLGSLMAKGAYLVQERRKLFTRLGETVYYKMVKGEFANHDLEPLVRELERVTKKVEIEEILIRNIRFGVSRQRGRRRLKVPEKENA